MSDLALIAVVKNAAVGIIIVITIWGLVIWSSLREIINLLERLG